MKDVNGVICLENRREIMTYDFGCPKQVIFKQEEDSVEPWCAGIAWGEVVVCACCGGTIPFDEIDEMEVFENYWVDFTEKIGGHNLVKRRAEEKREDEED